MITKNDVSNNSKNYFPLLVGYVNERTGEVLSKEVVEKPDDLANGKAFRVLKTNYSGE